MLASASQDKYLRVWRIQPEARTSASAETSNQDTADLAAAIARQVDSIISIRGLCVLWQMAIVAICNIQAHICLIGPQRVLHPEQAHTLPY